MTPDAPSETPPSRRMEAAQVSFGDELRRERELRGVDLRDIAEATKVSLRFLEALERNDFGALPGGLFTKGFIRAYAVHIGADPDRLVNGYLMQIARDREVPGGPAPGPRLEGPSPSGGAGRRRGAAVFLGLALLLSLPVAYVVLRPRIAPPPAEPGAGAAVPPPGSAEPAPAAHRLLEITATRANRVQVTCNGEVRLDRALVPGERVVLPCSEPIALSAASAGDLLLWLDGAALQPPAAAGVALEGWRLGGAESPS